MVHGKNIAKREILLEIASTLSNEHPGLLDLSLFEKELTSDKVKMGMSGDI